MRDPVATGVTVLIGEGVSRSAAETEAIGRRLGEAVREPVVLLLRGDLGSGKTVLARGLLRGLGVHAAVRSPTFTLMNTYAGRLPLYHFDAWRTGNEVAYLDDGGDEWLRGEGVAAVEWADRIGERLPAPRLVIRLAHRSASSRAVRVDAVGEAAEVAALAGIVAEATGRRSPE